MGDVLDHRQAVPWADGSSGRGGKCVAFEKRQTTVRIALSPMEGGKHN